MTEGGRGTEFCPITGGECRFDCMMLRPMPVFETDSTCGGAYRTGGYRGWYCGLAGMPETGFGLLVEDEENDTQTKERRES